MMTLRLSYVNAHTSSGIQSSTTPLAFEVLRLLMVNQDLQVVKVSLAIVAPGSGQNLLNVGMFALVLDHCCWFLTFERSKLL